MISETAFLPIKNQNKIWKKSTAFDNFFASSSNSSGMLLKVDIEIKIAKILRN